VSPARLAPPAADSCLVRSYSSRGQRGGTLIEERVADVATHEEWLVHPERYRPTRCGGPECGGDRLHLHDRRERHPRGRGDGPATVTILVFICMACSATWRVLPLFLARWLRYPWEVMERQTTGTPRAGDKVPERTAQRWRARLRQTARVPVQVLAVAGGALHAVVRRVGLEATRAELVAAVGLSFAALAELLHRLAPGVRLM
jgi:hypothetical protein